MDSTADSFLDRLDDLSWDGYKTVTCYFSDYRVSGNGYQYNVTFRGILKLCDQNPVIQKKGAGSVNPVAVSFINPYKPRSKIRLRIPSTVKNKNHSFDVSIFDINGKRIKHQTITKKNSFTWSGCSQEGTRVSNGFYILTVSGEQFVLNRKLVLSD